MNSLIKLKILGVFKFYATFSVHASISASTLPCYVINN